MRTLTIATSALAAFMTVLVSSNAKAEPAPPAVDWGRLASDLNALARSGASVLDSPRCGLAGCQTDTNATAAAPERVEAVHRRNTATDWFNVTPKFSLVARDWDSTYKVAGERLALVDVMRLTSSTRMVLARVRTQSRLSPFAQMGLGQWRTDPYLLPLTARYTEVAAQGSAGVELRLAGSWELALETAMTMLYREAHDSSMPATQIWSTTFASRVDF